MGKIEKVGSASVAPVESVRDKNLRMALVSAESSSDAERAYRIYAAADSAEAKDGLELRELEDRARKSKNEYAEVGFKDFEDQRLRSPIHRIFTKQRLVMPAAPPALPHQTAADSIQLQTASGNAVSDL